MSGHKVTLRRPDGDTETLARYPEHEDATSHLYAYCLWDDGHDWDVADDYRSAGAADGTQLTITPAPVYLAYQPGQVESDPRHGVLNWASRITSVDGLNVLPCDDSDPDAIEGRIPANTKGAVLPDADLGGYLATHERETLDPPKYYSRFPEDEMEPVAEGPPRDGKDGASYLIARDIEMAIRSLTGGGRYPASEITIHDCLPMPSIVSRESVGHILITPQLDRNGGDEQ